MFLKSRHLFIYRVVGRSQRHHLFAVVKLDQLAHVCSAWHEVLEADRYLDRLFVRACISGNVECRALAFFVELAAKRVSNDVIGIPELAVISAQTVIKLAQRCDFFDELVVKRGHFFITKVVESMQCSQR